MSTSYTTVHDWCTQVHTAAGLARRINSGACSRVAPSNFTFSTPIYIPIFHRSYYFSFLASRTYTIHNNISNELIWYSCPRGARSGGSRCAVRRKRAVDSFLWYTTYIICIGIPPIPTSNSYGLWYFDIWTRSCTYHDTGGYARGLQRTTT